MAKFSWETKNGDFSAKIKTMSAKTLPAVRMYASTKSNALEAQMKKNRRWTDRTGLAKATLNATVSEPNKNTVRITLSHGVNYGLWLELAHEKNYAIIAPTIREEGPKVLNDIGNLLDKIK